MIKLIQTRCLRAPCLFFCLLSSSSLSAQQSQSENSVLPEIPRFETRTAAIDIDPIPSIYWKDARYNENNQIEYEYKRLDIATNRRGSSAQIPILDGEVQLFRILNPNDPASEENLTPALKLDTVEAGDQKLLLFYREPSGTVTYRLVDENPDIHPAQHVRVLNLTNRTLAAMIGQEQNSLIEPFSSKTLGKPDLNSASNFLLKVYVKTPDGNFFEYPSKRLTFPSDQMRLLVIYANFKHIEEAEGDEQEDMRFYKPVAYRMYDTVPEKHKQ